MKYYKADSADIVGDVELSEDCSVFFNAVIRGDHHKIVIGENTNIQDCVVIHTGTKYPVSIGKNVTIGHGAIVHGCEIGDNVLIGMGAIIMNGCKIGSNSIIGAGALVTEHTVVEEGSVVFGSPAKVKRQVTEKEIDYNKRHALEDIENEKQDLKLIEKI